MFMKFYIPVFSIFLLLSFGASANNDFNWWQPEYYGFSEAQYKKMKDDILPYTHECLTEEQTNQEKAIFCEKVNNIQEIGLNLDKNCSKTILEVFNIDGEFVRYQDYNDKDLCKALKQRYFMFLFETSQYTY